VRLVSVVQRDRVSRFSRSDERAIRAGALVNRAVTCVTSTYWKRGDRVVNDETDLCKVIAYLHDLDAELDERSCISDLDANSAARGDML
jgi:hypothetical protein